MGWGSGSERHLWWIVGIVLMVLLFVGLSRLDAPWPLIFIFFWFGRPMFFRHRAGPVEKRKRKNDEKRKRDKTEQARYFEADDGQVLEIVDAPDARKQRDD